MKLSGVQIVSIDYLRRTLNSKLIDKPASEKVYNDNDKIRNRLPPDQHLQPSQMIENTKPTSSTSFSESLSEVTRKTTDDRSVSAFKRQSL